ncbi:MAG: TonB-dependent receptor, partial [Cyclobacteriaceae bacterium]
TGMVVSGQAQETTPSERGEIRDTEFIIRKDRVLSLPQQPRVLEKTPDLPPVISNPSYDYQVKDFFIDLQPLQVQTQPFVKPFQPETTFQSLGRAKIGYGNYASPLLQLNINNFFEDEMSYGLHLSHEGYYLGPVDGNNSAEDHTQLGLNGSLFTDFIEFYGRLGYQRDLHHFYGYSPIPSLEIIPEDIRQVFNTVETTIGLRRIEKAEPFDYGASASFRLFEDNYAAEESEGNVKVNADFRPNEQLKGGIAAMFFFTTPSDVNYSDITRNYFKLHPHVTYLYGGIHLNIGANVIQENDIVPNKTKDLFIFPTAFLSYHFAPEFGVYGRYEGDVLRKTYFDFVMENPYLGPSTELRNTIQNHQVDAGISGTLAGNLDYEAGIEFGNYTNMHFYGNNVNDSTRFELLYDNESQMFNFHASANYKFEKRYQLEANLNYYQYYLTELEAAWHRPLWEFGLKNTFIPQEEWMIQANINAMGGIDVINMASESTDTLKPLLDLHISVDYAINPRLSVFAKGNNLLNQNYERFQNYRVRGIQGIGGIGFKF